MFLLHLGLTRKHSISIKEVGMLSISNYVECLKIIETEAVFDKTEINDEWNINFLQNSTPSIQHIHFSEFIIDWSTFETFLFYIVRRCAVIFLFISPTSSNITCECKKNKKNLHGTWSCNYGVGCPFKVLQFDKNISFKKYWHRNLLFVFCFSNYHWLI